MFFVYNPVTDTDVNYTWKTYILKNNNNTIAELKEKFINLIDNTKIKTDRIEKVTFTNGKTEEISLYINNLSMDFIVVYKNGKKETGTWNRYFKNNRITINGLAFSKGLKWNQVDHILFYDSLSYHPAIKKYWSENGISYLQSMEDRKQILNNLIASA